MRYSALMIYGGLALVLGGYLMDSLSGYSNGKSNNLYFFTIMGAIFAPLFVGCGIWIWLLRNVQLTIDTASGEVRFGQRVLANARAIHSVVVNSPPTDFAEDVDRYFITLKLMDMTTVEIPSPSFSSIGNKELTTELAQVIASKLHVLVRSV